MSTWLFGRALLAIVGLMCLLPSTAAASHVPQTAGSFRQVGHEPLMNRGMNAALAIHGDYAYVGSRTDAHEGTPHGGIMVADI